jgi:hypothetical protein
MSILRTETKRLVTLTLGKYKAVVAKHENEYDEFVTKYYNDGYYMKNADDFQATFEDAECTAIANLNHMNKV